MKIRGESFPLRVLWRWCQLLGLCWWKLLLQDTKRGLSWGSSATECWWGGKWWGPCRSCTWFYICIREVKFIWSYSASHNISGKFKLRLFLFFSFLFPIITTMKKMIYTLVVLLINKRIETITIAFMTPVFYFLIR